MQHALILLFLFLGNLTHPASAAITNANLALIVNDNDPQSVSVAEYYQKSRQIPATNIIHIAFDHQAATISAAAFNVIRAKVESRVAEDVQAYALTWTKPYKVACMSITSAFALGFDKAYCAQGCQPTKSIPYYNSSSGQPYRDFGIRPTMMLAGENSINALQLIDRGVIADASRPRGRAYLVSTSDKHRNVRAANYPVIASRMQALVDIEVVKADYIRDKKDVLFYFTGLKRVPHVTSNTYLPGAVADHLTSSGGALFGDQQMSAIKWLEAGATGSYGTVTEPCNFPGKFPNPGVLMLNYMRGDTLIEAYWKSVSMPGQGLFIGEPLSSPFKGCRIKRNLDGILLFANDWLSPNGQHTDPGCGLSPSKTR